MENLLYSATYLVPLGHLTDLFLKIEGKEPMPSPKDAKVHSPSTHSSRVHFVGDELTDQVKDSQVDSFQGLRKSQHLSNFNMDTSAHILCVKFRCNLLIRISFQNKKVPKI